MAGEVIEIEMVELKGISNKQKNLMKRYRKKEFGKVAEGYFGRKDVQKDLYFLIKSFGKIVSFGMVTPIKIDYRDHKYDILGLGGGIAIVKNSGYDILHNAENEGHFRQNTSDFKQIVTDVLNGNSYDVAIRLVNTTNAEETTLRIKNVNSDFSDNFKDAVVNNPKPVVMSGGYGRLLMAARIAYIKSKGKTGIGFCERHNLKRFEAYGLNAKKNFIRRFVYRDPKTGEEIHDHKGDMIYVDGPDKLVTKMLKTKSFAYCDGIHW